MIVPRFHRNDLVVSTSIGYSMHIKLVWRPWARTALIQTCLQRPACVLPVRPKLDIAEIKQEDSPSPWHVPASMLQKLEMFTYTLVIATSMHRDNRDTPKGLCP